MKLQLGGVLLSLALWGAVSTAAAQDADLIHSDLPLWRPGEAVWPARFSDGFGCANPMELGVWRYTAAGRDDPSGASYEFSNYGAVHCWINVAELGEGDRPETPQPSFLIDLGQAAARRLWVLQIGARPGSDYLLLSERRRDGVIRAFDVLRRRCPAGRMRMGTGLDIVRTDYCALNSRSDVIALAQEMAGLPPAGTLVFDPSATRRSRRR